MTIENFQTVARQFNERLTVTVTNQGRGGEEHWRIIGGRVPVSWWPFSDKGTAMCEGTNIRVRVRNSNVQKVLELTNRQPSNRSPKLLQRPQNHQVPCPNCGQLMNLRTDSQFKNKLWYACPNWPDCRGCHGAHPDGKPLGIPADKETKDWRIKAHEAFDELWKSGQQTRPDTYRWLAKSLEIPLEKCHISSFDSKTCQKVVELCNEFILEKIQRKALTSTRNDV